MEPIQKCSESKTLTSQNDPLCDPENPELQGTEKEMIHSTTVFNLQETDSIEHYGQKDPIKKYDPLVISGPSGAGKGTLIRYLLDNFPSKFAKITSYTTRAPRAGEMDGREYFFVSRDEFLAHAERGIFIEYREIFGNYYGSSKEEVERVSKEKKICLLEIDVVAAEKISKGTMNCNYLFIMPPSIEELRKRLQSRGSETRESIDRRMIGAEEELKFAEKSEIYRNKLSNIDLDTTKKELLELLNKIYEIDLQASA